MITMNNDSYLSTIQPCEICSIRPPTENNSLTFMLTRNCCWNKCALYPAYKLNERFNKNPPEDMKIDIINARRIDDLLTGKEIGHTSYSSADYSKGTALLANEINRARRDAGIIDSNEDDATPIPDDIGPRLAWFLRWFNEKPGIEDSIMQILSWRIHGGKTCSLGDADLEAVTRLIRAKLMP